MGKKFLTIGLVATAAVVVIMAISIYAIGVTGTVGALILLALGMAIGYATKTMELEYRRRQRRYVIPKNQYSQFEVMTAE